MKLKNKFSSIESTKFFYWLKTLSKFVSIQLVIQVLGFISGILIVRVLNKQEYAYFLIANAMQSTIDLMSDLGITIGLTSIGGQIYHDKLKLSQLINTAFVIRRRLIIISILVVTPVLFWILITKGTSFEYAFLLVLLILIELQFYSTNKILITVPRIQSQFQQVQASDLIASGSRLVLLCLAYLTKLSAVTAVLCSAFSSGIQSFNLIKLVKKSILIDASINPEYEFQIWSLIKSQFPATLFYCLQGQIVIWLITIFGKTASIAEVGALSRLGLVFTIFSPVVTTIIVPNYARQQLGVVLQRRYLQIVGGWVLLSGFITLLVGIFPNQILWILGEQYIHLKTEMFLMVLSSLLSSLTMVVWSLNYAKAWVNESWLTIPSTIGMQIFLLLILNLSTVRGVIIFTVFSAIPPLLVNFYMSYKGLKLIFISPP